MEELDNFWKSCTFREKVQNIVKNNIHSNIYSELTPPRVTRLARLVQRHNCDDCMRDSGRSCHQAYLRIPSTTDIVMEN
jgi:hypothetical protein